MCMYKIIYYDKCYIVLKIHLGYIRSKVTGIKFIYLFNEVGRYATIYRYSSKVGT